jgi:hypothetical protein
VKAQLNAVATESAKSARMTAAVCRRRTDGLRSCASEKWTPLIVDEADASSVQTRRAVRLSASATSSASAEKGIV